MYAIPNSTCVCIVAYAYSQGASQGALGAMMALGAITGIAATFTYPKIRKCIGNDMFKHIYFLNNCSSTL